MVTAWPKVCPVRSADTAAVSWLVTSVVELPSTSVTAAVRAISLSVTLTTVTVAPMGRSSSMWAAQAARMSSSTGPLSAPAMTTLTVPFPAQSGMQLA